MPRYSDDEEISWKVRTIAPSLLDRSSDREESVRSEVLAALEVLLKQTIAARTAEIALGGRNKRKRSQELQDENDSSDSR